MTTAKKTDSELQQAVLNELRGDTRVRETEVGVEVRDGVVTLVGPVDSWAKRMAAAEAAHRVRGVLDVANELQVRLPGSGVRTDTDIAHAVRTALIWDVFVPDEEIHSTVSEGVVTLKGTVDFFSQKEDAERAIRNLRGVTMVLNWIEIRAPAAASNVRKAIQEALERHAVREANHIQVSVDDGKVTLQGPIDSWAEHNAVLGAVRATRGVRMVEDKLYIG
jgi:osmotically-inducible protein OsmY